MTQIKPFDASTIVSDMAYRIHSKEIEINKIQNKALREEEMKRLLEFKKKFVKALNDNDWLFTHILF